MGDQVYSNHAAVIVLWRTKPGTKQYSKWKVDFFSLADEVVYKSIVSEREAFVYNERSACELIIRDAFKAYLRAIMISLKAHKEREKNKVSDNLLVQIQKGEKKVSTVCR